MVFILCYNQNIYKTEELDLKLQTVFISMILLTIVMMSGCSSRNIEVKNSGFFKEYDSIKTKGSTFYQDSKVDLSSYKNIVVTPVLVISAIKENEQTPEQKKLYKDISEYLTSEYKKEISKSGKYTLVDSSTPNSLILESAVSTVEVHLGDEKWNQFSPISMGLSVVSFNVYMDEDVRLLGEKRLVDSTSGDVLSRSMHILRDEKVIINGDKLEFSDIKPALDSWLKQVKQDLLISE